ncbi:hypothetical protein ACN28E_39780 [Archangium lansingense]|uniref:hypothetical protein n=1 Tax=Archangium lansingense TaxID=2995310 RepID=UPI003B78E7E4
MTPGPISLSGEGWASGHFVQTVGAAWKGQQPPVAAVGCEDFGLLAAVARAGGGVAVLPTFLASQDVAAGTLERLRLD